MSLISEKEVRSFEEKVYNLEIGINGFNKKVSRCELSGIIDLSHKIEIDIDKLKNELSGFVKFQTTPVEEIRNERLKTNFSKLKSQYELIKTIFETECECRRRYR